MASSSWPTPNADPNLDRVVNDVQYEKLAIGYSGNGLLGKPSDSPPVYATGTEMAVHFRAYKRAVILGHEWYSGPVDFTKDVTPNTTNLPRKDLVVLQLDRATWKTTEVIKAGTPASNPTLPGLQQDVDDAGAGAGKFELPVASFLVPANGVVPPAANVATVGWYLAPQPLLATATSMPSPAAAQLVYQSDFGLLWVGNGSSFDLVAGSGSRAAYATADSPAVTAEAVLLTLPAYVFAPGVAYEVKVSGRIWANNPDNAMVLRVRKTNVNGTVYLGFGRITADQAGSAAAKDMGDLSGIVANTTSAAVTADIALTGEGTTGGAIYHGGTTTRPRYVRIRPIGRAADYPEATAIS